jgi:hypothetical protein
MTCATYGTYGKQGTVGNPTPKMSGVGLAPDDLDGLMQTPTDNEYRLVANFAEVWVCRQTDIHAYTLDGYQSMQVHAGSCSVTP